ncbi:T-cell activation Rho GTPase-activating protein-like [Struthio camelus]|uniref:T-cell activation Rho GTPase-activating protein-like n=1 Tax=Struthio camelus TaxID=8801 RepID=UPI003603FE45
MPFPVHKPSAGAPGARVTRLPSLRFLTKVDGFYGPEVSLTAATVEMLILAEADAKKCPRLDPPDMQEGPGHPAAEGVKARRQGISWPPARKGTPANRDGPGHFDPGPSVALFGRPLAALCGEDGNLAQPVQHLLAILYEKGPDTEGIFRKAANERARRELKEVLDQGENAHLDSRPVHLLAVVLKDFLRNIPAKLLSDNLFDERMLALEKPSQQDKIDKLREVADNLPSANLLLLQRLLAVLHHISEKAETSKRDASNLAIGVGPNLLSLDMGNVLPLAAQERNDKVTALVEFLTDNCRAIFGEDVALPFSHSAEESLEHTDSSTGQPGAPQHNGSACNSAEPAAEGSPPASELQQPNGRGSSLRRPYPTCASAPSPRNITSGISSVDRWFSEPHLSFHNCSEGRRRELELSPREGNFPVQQQQLRVEEEALDTTPLQCCLCNHHMALYTQTILQLLPADLLLWPDASIFTSTTLLSASTPSKHLLKRGPKLLPPRATT